MELACEVAPSCYSWHRSTVFSGTDVRSSQHNLYRAVDSAGNTLDFLLSATRDAQAAKRFFTKTLVAPHTVPPRIITVDKNAAYPKAFNQSQEEGILPKSCALRQSKYLNNLIEQDHRFMKRLVKLGMGFFSFEAAWRTDTADMKR